MIVITSKNRTVTERYRDAYLDTLPNSFVPKPEGPMEQVTCWDEETGEAKVLDLHFGTDFSELDPLPLLPPVESPAAPQKFSWGELWGDLLWMLGLKLK